MSRKTRYEFIKQKHKNYLILFYEKNNYCSYSFDQKLFDQFETLGMIEQSQISYMVFQNLSKIKQFDSNQNQYLKYQKLDKLKTIFELLKRN